MMVCSVEAEDDPLDRHFTPHEDATMTPSRIRSLTLVAAAWAVLLGAAGRSSADLLDLTGNGAQGVLNGALFQQGSVQPAGTGVFSSFLRIQANGTEQGYNTDYRPVEFDEKTDPHTHSLFLSKVPLVTIGGVNYRQFSLDINQENNGGKSLLSLDKLEVYLGNLPDLHNYPNLGTKIYDMGPGNYVLLDDKLSHGSGSSDMFLNIPDSLFAGGSPYVYLFSRFGDHEAANGGFEEWAAQCGCVAAVPEPTSLCLFGLGAAGFGACWCRRRATAATAAAAN
jgi:hypothetical protein